MLIFCTIFVQLEILCSEIKIVQPCNFFSKYSGSIKATLNCKHWLPKTGGMATINRMQISDGHTGFSP
jgi:hypothetical protein